MFVIFVVSLALVIPVKSVSEKININVCLNDMLGESIMLNMNKYNTRFENGSWVCDCPHSKFRGTYCRHILQKLLDIRGKTDGVRDTSLDAYLEIISDPGSLNDRYQDILIALSEMVVPSSDYEIASHMGFDDPNKVRPRRYELVNDFYKPFLEEKGKRVCRKTGKTVFVWGLTKEGCMLVDDLRKVLS